MTTVLGVWDATSQSPIGPQTSVLTLSGSDDSFSGSSVGPMGSAEVQDGSVSGDEVVFTMKLTTPFPMTVTVNATLDGDSMAGKVDTGAFGKMDFTATRKS